MESAPAISVVISTFNRAASLAVALNALVRQQVPPGLDFEIIIVDNNATDETRAVVESFSAVHRPIRYVLEMQQGVSHGRNAGIHAARAPIVAFTDDDNIVAHDWIARISQAFDRYPDVAAVGGRVLPRWESPPPKWLDRRHWSPLAILDYGDEPFYTNASNPKCLLTANLAVRRKLFSTTGEFSPAFPRCQDHELLIRIWRSGANVLYEPGLLAYATVSADRMTRRYHRAWHRTHGTYAAMMRLQEVIDLRGHLVEAPAGDGLRLYGTPGFVYRAAARQARLWVKSLVHGDASGAEAHANDLRYFIAYIRRTARLHSAHERPFREALSFVRAYIARACANLTFTRIAIVHALIAGLVGASFYDIITGREHWPVSPYPMFSTVEHQPTLDGLRLFGVTDEARPREIPLLDRSMIGPFDQTRISTAFARALANPERRSAVDDMLRDCLLRYERLRALGINSGPPLRAVRLYDEHWTLDADAANVDTPDRRRLVASSDQVIERQAGGHAQASPHGAN